MKKVIETVVLEVDLNIPKNQDLKWKLLDVLDEKGNGLLPRGRTQQLMEEQ